MEDEPIIPPRSKWKEPNVVQVRVELCDIQPAIWRLLHVPLATTLDRLHFILQAAMGWKDTHLHEFDVGGLRYGDLSSAARDQSDFDAKLFDETEVRLRDFSRRPGTSFVYVYDFGDNWRHQITLEKLISIEPPLKVAACVDGARCCPPEDVGGPHGYFEFLRILTSPEPDEHEEQAHYKRWSGGKFDPEKFDTAKADRAVRAALKKDVAS